MSDRASRAGRSAGALDSAVERLIADTLPRNHDSQELSAYYRLLRDYPERGGKRLRARLTLLSTKAHGAGWREGLTAAAALELFQNWVLIHDDVEDDSLERRGLPTLHRQVGKPLAINVGDGLHAYMWQLLLGDRTLAPGVADEFLWMIHRTSEGQHLDLAWIESGRFDVSEPEYLEMVRLKTACYTVITPLRLGAICAGLVPDERLSAAGEDLGVAFQIRDDVLDLTPGVKHGKQFAGDLFEGKRTLILAHFFSQASAGEGSEAIDRLSAPRSGRTGADVAALLELFARHGSIAYAQEVAEQRARRGLALLREVLEPVAAAPDLAELAGLLESLALRSR